MKLIRSLMLTTLVASMTFAQTTPAPATPPATQPSTQPADAAAAQQALLKFNAAIEAMDLEKIFACVHFTDDQQRKTMQLMGELSVACDKLYKATLAKFGEAALKKERVFKEQFQAGFRPLPLEQLQVKVEGDKAALLSAEGDVIPIALTRTPAGEWKIDGSKFESFPPEMFEQQKQMIGAVSTAMNNLSDDVAGGHVRSADEVPVLMQHRINKAITEIRMKQLPPELMEPDAAPTTAPAGPPTPSK